MPTFSFQPVLDGDELPQVQRTFAHRVQAIAHGAAVLRTVIATKPATAYVAVFCGGADDAEPLGAWDWSADQPEPAWSADS